jgi:Pyruvate/2-oxoacid:ferredoxin oxidoreductase gamma subunit
VAAAIRETFPKKIADANVNATTEAFEAIAAAMENA